MTEVPVELDEMIREVTRELKMRKAYFGERVRFGEMNPRLANRRIAIMEAVLDLVVSEKKRREPPLL